MFEVLFRVLTKEKSAYVKSSKSNIRNIAASRLTSCAEAFRLAVETTLTHLRLKTVRALVEHIVQTLPTSADEVFCKPLEFYYLKTLAIITDYQPHVEHLPREDWHAALDLCLEGVEALAGQDQSQASNHEILPQLEASSVRTVSFSQSLQSRNKRSEDSKMTISTLWQILANLVIASNAPLGERSRAILTTSVDFLDHTRLTKGIREAFSTLNAVLRRFALDHCSFAAEIMRSMISIVRSFWHSRDADLMDEMLKTLVIGEPLVSKLMKSYQDETLFDQVEALYDAMCDDYWRSHGRPRRHLLLEDICLGFSRPSRDTMPMQGITLCLRAAKLESEHNWTVLHMMALFCGMIDSKRPQSRSLGPSEDEPVPKKRRKTLGKYSELLHLSRTTAVPTQVHCLQLLAFAIDLHDLCADQVEYTLACVLPLVSHPNTQVSSWAMLCISW